jgi:thiol-activated cytolysin
MNREVIDYLYGLKRSESDLAYDGTTKLLTQQTVDGNQCILIRYEKQNITNSLDTMLVLSTIKSTIYPGSVILANSDLVNGTPTEVSLAKRDGRLTIDPLHLSAGSKMDSSSANATIDRLLLNYLADEKLKPQANFSYSYTEAFSKKQVKASLGVDCDKIKLSCDFEAIKSGESRAVIIAFNQVYFTATFDRPVNADVFADSVTVDDLKRAGVVDNSVPCYISSVSYGRAFFVCLQTRETSLDMKAVAQATVKEITLRTKDELHEKLKNCSTTCVCLGGDPKSHVNLISGDLDQISKVINENIELSSAHYGYPITYCCNYLTDNKVAAINSASEYVKVTRTVTDGHSLHLSSNCAYVFKWRIEWTLRNVDTAGSISESTQNYPENGKKKTSGWGDTIQIPANATKIHVRCDDYWWFGRTRNVCDLNVALRNNIKVKVKGTTLSPKAEVTYWD